MPAKKFWKNKNKNKTKRDKHGSQSISQRHQDGRTSARLAIEDMIFNPTELTSSPTADREASKFGQAPTRTSRDISPWHDPFHSYLYPPTSLNFRPPFDPDGSHLARRSPGLTEYEGRSIEVTVPVMAPGHDQPQNRSQPPPHYRPNQQQNPNQQRSNANPNDTPINGEQQQRTQAPKDRDTERDQQQPRRSNGVLSGSGPMPSHIQVAKPYVFQQAIEGCLKDVGVTQAREDNIRLAGVRWIDDVRRALKLPVRTFDTAVVYYHKFRLVHSDGEYSFVDAAAAALFAACKIEDTLKKSRDILCAAHNLKVPRNEHLSPDDTTFEHPSRSIIGLERLMLEASSFDFRNRHPQILMIKLAKHYNLGSPSSSSTVRTAYSISLDLYRTFAPLKQSTAPLAFACLELAIRLHNNNTTDPPATDTTTTDAILTGTDYSKWSIMRAEVMETLLDLLELYTHYRTSTTVGPEFPLDTFLEVRILLNEELNASNLPRFTEYIDVGRGVDPAGYAATVNGVSVAPTSTTTKDIPTAPATGSGGKNEKSPTSPSGAAKVNGIRQKAGERGREGTVRFMLNPDRERQERLVVAEYLPQPQSQGHGHGQAHGQSQGQIRPQTPSRPAAQEGQSHRGSQSGRGSGHGHGRGHGQGHGHGPGPSNRGGHLSGPGGGDDGGDPDHRPSRKHALQDK